MTVLGAMIMAAAWAALMTPTVASVPASFCVDAGVSGSRWGRAAAEPGAWAGDRPWQRAPVARNGPLTAKGHVISESFMVIGCRTGRGKQRA